MAAFVLDASIAISWCFPNDPTENTPYSRAVLQRLQEWDAVVPEIWAFEIANGIFVAHNKRNRIDAAGISEYLTLLELLPIQVVGRRWQEHVRSEALARKHNLSAYDISYLDLAVRESLPLATSDEALRKAAITEGVTIL